MIDLTRLRSITGGDKETETLLLNLFLETAQRVLTGLQSGNGDWKMLVHELKGASANLGVGDLQKTCRQVELGEPQGPAREAFFAEIRQTMDEVRRLIAS